MAETLDLTTVILKHIGKLKAFVRNPTSLLKQIGALVVNDCRRSFGVQKLGNLIWPERYPNQSSPKLNIAGVLADFISGRTAPKPNRFEDRPALVDEGMRGGLQSTSSLKILSINGVDTVRIGTNKLYARLHQEGGDSVQNYDEATKGRIRNWVLAKSGKSSKRKVTEMWKQTITRSDYYAKLKWFLHDHLMVYKTKVNARPFVGVTDQAEADMKELIKRTFEKAQS